MDIDARMLAGILELYFVVTCSDIIFALAILAGELLLYTFNVLKISMNADKICFRSTLQIFHTSSVIDEMQLLWN